MTTKRLAATGDPTAIVSCEGCAQKDGGTRRRGDDKHLTGKGRHHGTTARSTRGIGT